MRKTCLKFICSDILIKIGKEKSICEVAVLSAEAVPYSKTGGLGDVAGALPKALRQIGVNSLLITPCYRQTKGEYLWNLALDDLWVDWRGRRVRAKAFYSEANGSPTFLIDAPEFFHRSAIYGFTEDYERFAFFCRAALAWLKRIGAPPDIVHLNDWHTGFAAVHWTLRVWDSFWANTRTFFRFIMSLIKAVSRGRAVGFGFRQRLGTQALLC